MYPVVNAGRVVQSFNDGWYYAACDDNRLQEVQRHEEGWQQVHLPHTWNADAYSTRNYRRASSWYKKEFRTDAAQMRDKQLYLKFDGVNSLADVYLNGELLTTHKGGYSAFTVDITDKVRTDAPNLLMVHVNNQTTGYLLCPATSPSLAASTAMCGSSVLQSSTSALPTMPLRAFMSICLP